MILRYYGHSFFALEMENGKVITFDPYGDLYDLPRRKIACDLCLISHHHFDHDGISSIANQPLCYDKPGSYAPFEGVHVYGVETDHDEKGGALRGKNTIFIVEAEGLRIVHCGDLGHVLTEGQLRQIGQPDVLLIPVGGYYTIDGEAAVKVQRQLDARVTVPMHYKTKYHADMPIASLEDFCKLIRKEAKPMPFMRISSQDIGEREAWSFLSMQA